MWSRTMAIGIACAGLLSAAPRLQAAGGPSDAPPLAEMEEAQPAQERSTAQAAGTAFSYQGQIKQNGAPINGNTDVRITMWDDLTAGQSYGTSTFNIPNVSNGIFTVTLNGGTMWSGQAIWLQIEVRFPAGSGNYTSLSPRQPVLAVPYAMGLVPQAEIRSDLIADPTIHVINDSSGEALRANANGVALKARSEASNGVEGLSFSSIASGVYGQNDAGGYGVAARVTGGGVALLADGTNTGSAALFTQGNVDIFGGDSNLRVYGGDVAVDTGNVEVPGGKATFGAATRQMLDLWSSVYGIGVQSYTLYNRTDLGAGYAWHAGGQHSDSHADPGPGGRRLMYLDHEGRLSARNGLWAQGVGNNIDPLIVTGTNDVDREFRVSNIGEVFADGTFHPGGADFAELLPAEDGLEPGDALVIGRDGKLAKSDEPYQTSVVGVYSTQPGVLGGANDVSHEGKVPLAVVGVVPVKVTDENGPIAPGDLLTTSSVPGLAMKASSEISMSGRTTYPNGSIIGKALSGLESGQGTIQVLLIAK